MNGLQAAVILFGLVVEGDIAPRDRGVQRPAGIGNASTGFSQLPIPLGCFRRREVEVVGDRQRFGTNTAEIARGFSHGRLSTAFGVKSHPAVGTVNRCSHTPCGGLKRTFTLLRAEPHHGSIGSA